MANRKTKPTSPGRRFATFPLREQLTASEPERKLTEGLRKSGGRNSNGRITARHRGGGAKRRYRKIDFKRLKDSVPAKVATAWAVRRHHAGGLSGWPAMDGVGR
jgi:large subunit ribosomal protein L2